jgi:hypothetical protein
VNLQALRDYKMLITTYSEFRTGETASRRGFFNDLLRDGIGLVKYVEEAKRRFGA